MRFTRLIPALAMPLLVVACGQDAATAPDPPQFNELAGPPLEFPFTTQFPAFNPCTSQGILVTNTGTLWVQTHPNNRVIRVKGTTTSSDGYTGRYNETWTGSDIFGPGGMSIRTINTQVTNPSGSRYMVHLVWVIDAETSPPTWRVDRFSATCVIP
ncbi:MAG: hypothetical protein ACYS7M_14280 [Planctomycetota bacterium]